MCLFRYRFWVQLVVVEWPSSLPCSAKHGPLANMSGSFVFSCLALCPRRCSFKYFMCATSVECSYFIAPDNPRPGQIRADCVLCTPVLRFNNNGIALAENQINPMQTDQPLEWICTPPTQQFMVRILFLFAYVAGQILSHITPATSQHYVPGYIL